MSDGPGNSGTNVIKMMNGVPGEEDTYHSVSDEEEIDGAKFFSLAFTDQQLANLVEIGANVLGWEIKR